MRNNKEEDGASCLDSTHACQRVSLCAHVCKKGTGRGHEGQTRRRHPKQAKGKKYTFRKNKRGGGKCATTATTPNEETLGSCTRATEKADSPHTHTHTHARKRKACTSGFCYPTARTHPAILLPFLFSPFSFIGVRIRLSPQYTAYVRV